MCRCGPRALHPAKAAVLALILTGMSSGQQAKATFLLLLFPLFPAFHKHNYSPFGDAVSVGKLQPLNCIAPICAQTLQLLIVYRSDPRPLLTRAASSPPPRPPVACEGLLYPACRSMPVSAGGGAGSGPLNPLSENNGESKISGFDEGEEAVRSGSKR